MKDAKAILATLTVIWALLLAGGTAAFAQEGNRPIITLDETNESLRIKATPESSTSISSPYDSGTVIDISEDPENASRLGRYVAVEYRLALEIEGQIVSRGEVIVIYSNLKSTAVALQDDIEKGQKLGTTYGEGEVEEPGLSVFVLTRSPDNAYLTIQTRDQKVEHGDYWYWNPGFLFGGGSRG